MEGKQLAVGIIGYGTIGKVVAARLHSGAVPGATLVAVHTRSAAETEVGPSSSFEEALQRSDLMVECAGHGAVATLGPATLEAGVDLLVSSVGALVDDDVCAEFCKAGPGSLLLTTGALGGFDLLRAAGLAGPLTRVHLATTKHPRVLVQEWMCPEEIERLHSAREPFVVFDGSAREAAAKFPRSANVAAALALACGGWSGVKVTVVADPDTDSTHHSIECECPSGDYRFSIRNRPVPSNPATSAITPYALLRGIGDQIPAVPWRFQ